MAEFSPAGDVEKFTRVDDVCLTSTMPPLDEQMAQLAALGPGWFDGANPGVAESLAEYVRVLLTKITDQINIPTPAMFATPDGGVRAEWSVGDAEISMEALSLDEPIYLHMVHLRTGVDADALVGVAATDAVIENVIKFLDPLFP